jgi:hypothetical protein
VGTSRAASNRSVVLNKPDVDAHERSVLRVKPSFEPDEAAFLRTDLDVVRHKRSFVQANRSAQSNHLAVVPA